MEMIESNLDVISQSDEFFNFDQARGKLDNLISAWNPERDRTLIRRKIRKVDIDVEKLKRENKIKSDETLVGIRTVDTNIRREEPSFIKYIKSSRRLAIFKSVDIPNVPTDELEAQFTDGMQYEEWEVPLMQVKDGAATHGWDAVEIEFDTSKPLNVGITHIGHENLLFPPDSKNIQNAERLMRRYELTPLQLKRFVRKYNFNSEEVNKLLGEKNASQKDEVNIEVYKVFFKYDGIVYVAWYCRDCNDWLLAPKKLFLGRVKVTSSVGLNGEPEERRQNIDETSYPIKILFYVESENSTIFDHEGRVFLDKEKQEVHTALWTSYVNGCVRASGVFCSPAQPSNTGAPIDILDLTVQSGLCYTEPLLFWHPDYPDPNMLRAASLLDTKNMEETGQISFAVTSRKDSRKTAREISEASRKEEELTSVQTVLVSIFMRNVLSHAWLIVQSQALQNLIPLLRNPMTGRNDEARLSLIYIIKPAGDIDVIEREERSQKRKVLWPLVASTPLATVFLLDMIKEDLPADAIRYEQILMKGGEKDNLLKSMLTVIKEMMVFDTGEVKPEQEDKVEQVKALEQRVQAVLSNPLLGGA